MKSDTLRAKFERSAPAFADRTVTLLGATGSIGASTIDLLKRERERYPIVYGAKLKVKADQRVKPRTVLVEWDPFTNPILTEFTGKVEYQDIIDGMTVREEFDEVTGLARKVIIEDPEGRLQPGVGTTDLDDLPRAADFAGEVISALETRALWARYGL